MTSPNQWRLILPLACVLGMLGTPLAAQSVQPSVVDGALGDSVWYDSEEGRVLPIYVESVTDDSHNRNSRWLPKAKKVAKPTNTNTTTGGGGGGKGTGLFGSGLTFGNLFGWMLLVAILITVVALLVYGFSKAEVDLGQDIKVRNDAHSKTPDEQMIERMKHLPAELRRTDVNLRTEAERLMNLGQYDQAIILLFGHQLLLLDRAGLLRLNRGKTNGKYVRQTRSVDPEAGRLLRAVVIAFEQSYFGRYPIQQRDFAELWQGNQRLEELIQRRQERAA
ncbi:MAG: DUF4129 domain-containing protein [Pirellulales bacterium]|nr:DUF4129 domain-containing protein [Pirellulales bacterium]